MQKKFIHLVGRFIDVVVAPFVPKSYRLALQYAKHLRLMGWEPEALSIKSFARRGGGALDVGANMGLWTFAMAESGMFSEIIAFEPNEALTSDLKNAHLKGVLVLNKAVSCEAGTSRLRIPRQGQVLYSGWATLESRVDLDADDFQEMMVQTICLDDLDLVDISFVKIDVEGHELSVLEGARKLFSVSRPVCILECRDRNRPAINAFFQSLDVGYFAVDTKAKFGFDLSPGNVLFSTQ